MGPGGLFLGGLVTIAVFTALSWPEKGWIARVRRKTRLSDRVLIEDALKYVQKCSVRDVPARVDGLAGTLSISTNRATELVSRMTDDDLVATGDRGITLKAAGREAAVHLIRAHRLWERYLSDETGYAEAEWHNRAEIKEHDLSPEAADRLAIRLGNPIFDPHGDPIPDGQGAGPIRSAGVSLTTLEEGAQAKVVHVEDEPEVVYQQLVAAGIFPGTRVRMLEVSSNRIRILANGDSHSLAPIVARNLTVVSIEESQEPDNLEETAPLSALGLGQTARVVAIATSCRGPERRRLLDLGIVRGTLVTPEMRSPGGDPTAYRVRETLIALRESQAQHVRIVAEAAAGQAADADASTSRRGPAARAAAVTEADVAAAPPAVAPPVATESPPPEGHHE